MMKSHVASARSSSSRAKGNRLGEGEQRTGDPRRERSWNEFVTVAGKDCGVDGKWRC